MLRHDIHVDATSIVDFEKDKNHILEKISDYDFIISMKEFDDLGLDTSSLNNNTTVPSVYFPGYHPDICLLYNGMKSVSGAIGPYHSIIVFGCYNKNIPAKNVRAFFRKEIFQNLGYFQLWSESYANLSRDFSSSGLKIEHRIRSWAYGKSFMHTINHPKIECLYDIAISALEKNGLSVSSDALNSHKPYDNLIADCIFPVYPEIAAELGFSGSYSFKKPGQFRCLDLDQFISESYKFYATQDVGELRVDHTREAAYHAFVSSL